MRYLIDIDVAKYKIGFACQSIDEDTGALVVEPVEYCLATVKSHIRDLFQTLGITDNYKMYLTRGQSFREEQYPEYKKNRREKGLKPVLLPDIEKYLIDNYDTKVVEGIEADDAIGIEQYRDFFAKYVEGKGVKTALGTCIVSSDKDLNTIPGWHYNPNWNVKYIVSPFDAELFLACQMIMGDTADEVKGLPGKGKIYAFKALQNCETTEEIWESVWNEYQGHYKDVDKAEQEYTKNLTLLRILRHERN